MNQLSEPRGRKSHLGEAWTARQLPQILPANKHNKVCSNLHESSEHGDVSRITSAPKPRIPCQQPNSVYDANYHIIICLQHHLFENMKTEKQMMLLLMTMIFPSFLLHKRGAPKPRIPCQQPNSVYDANYHIIICLQHHLFENMKTEKQMMLLLMIMIFLSFLLHKRGAELLLPRTKKQSG
jgi:hypothetical protein